MNEPARSFGGTLRLNCLHPAWPHVVLFALLFALGLGARPAVAAADSSGAACCAAAAAVTDSLARPAEDTIPAWSASTSVPSFDFSDPAGDSHPRSGSWLWVGSSLLIVVGLLYLFLYLLRRFYHRTGGLLPGGGGQFQLLQQFHLGPKKSLLLVKTCGRVLLLGVTEHSINTLLEIDDEAELKEILETATGGGTQGTSFRDLYQGLLGRKKG